MEPTQFPSVHACGPKIRVRHGKDFLGLIALVVWFFYLSVPPASPHLRDHVPDPPPGTVGSKDPIFFDAASPAIDLVLNDRFKESLPLFEQLQQTYPDHPAPHFFKAATYQSWMSFSRLNRFQQEFEENIQLTIEKGH